ncbi:MAG: hypothetical protein QXJ74_02870 [Nitrososphaera sp.]
MSRQSSRRGVTTMVTVLAGVIAVLGTSVLFLSGESLSSFFGDVGRTFGNSQESQTQSEPLPAAQEQSGPPVETETEEQPAEVAEQPTIGCEALNIAGEHPAVHTGSDCFAISNEHIWVNKVIGRLNERTATAFVVENTGTTEITISSIRVKDVAVLSSHWFFTSDPSVVKPANLEKDLPADYTEGLVAIGGGLVSMKSGQITLQQGQAAIVYLDEAGGLTERDAGSIITLSVQAGQIQVEKAVTVVRA